MRDTVPFNIYKEHAKMGHQWRDKTDDNERRNIDTVNKRLYICSCGWLGWFATVDLNAVN
ncbi:hypothetical protein SEA_FORREST_240 [Streptomyces phage Forrest]|nr:hypothetical protein SEA_FORREST_240 [Streptomyces phage Forrest]QZE11572.1 hypothetical protein SEA_JADA_239 [Streptomyces phage Jada]